jgi:hypothetical protein
LDVLRLVASSFFSAAVTDFCAAAPAFDSCAWALLEYRLLGALHAGRHGVAHGLDLVRHGGADFLGSGAQVLTRLCEFRLLGGLGSGLARGHGFPLKIERLPA